MSLSEHGDSSAEYTTKPDLVTRMHGERAAAGSTLAYVEQLGRRYLADQDHKPNMLQLQRMAGFITNPSNEPTFPIGLTNSFYWGEILAYHAQDMLDNEDWVHTAYPLFSAVMSEHADMAQVLFQHTEMPDRTHREELQAVADTIMGELEEVDVEFMPPAMEAMIVDMTEELSAFPENRWYMILGFRHITSQVVQTAINAEIQDESNRLSEDERLALAKEIKIEQKERAKTMRQFIKMMDKNEIDDIQGRELIGIDDVRERIMESYADHMVAYGDFDRDDEDAVDAVSTFLTQTMNRDFVELEDIEADDFLEVGGSAVFIFYDQDGLRQAYMLGKNEYLKGSVESVAVTETPSVQAILRLQERSIEAYEMDDDTDPLGAVMILKDPVLVNAAGEHIQTDPGVLAAVVMANPHMTLSKHLL